MWQPGIYRLSPAAALMCAVAAGAFIGVVVTIEIVPWPISLAIAVGTAATWSVWLDRHHEHVRDHWSLEGLLRPDGAQRIDPRGAAGRHRARDHHDRQHRHGGGDQGCGVRRREAE